MCRAGELGEGGEEGGEREEVGGREGVGQGEEGREGGGGEIVILTVQLLCVHTGRRRRQRVRRSYRERWRD